jgi:IS5 family transposase
VRGHPLGELDKGRNRRIGLKKRPVGRTFAVVKRVFNYGRVLVTSLLRVRVKLVFSCLCFNLLQLGALACPDIGLKWF